jgi:hypothetical protein
MVRIHGTTVVVLSARGGAALRPRSAGYRDSRGTQHAPQARADRTPDAVATMIGLAAMHTRISFSVDVS